MTLREAASQIFNYRIKEGDLGWDEMVQELSKMGTFSLSASPKKFEKLILELCKRVEKLEDHAERGTSQ